MNNNKIPRPGIELLSGLIQRDPFPTYIEMRDKYPVCQIEPDGIVAISRYKDVRAALKNSEVFSSKAVLALYQPEWLSEAARRDYSIFSQDPPEHTRNRTLINKAFVTKVIERLSNYIVEIAKKKVDEIPRGVPVDALEFSGRYACNILGKITGAENATSYDDLKKWAALSHVLTLSKPDEAHVAALEAIQLKQTGQLLSVIKERRLHPCDDLVSELVHADLNGEKLDDRMLTSLLELLVSAGVDTVAYMLTHCIMYLADTPSALSNLKEQPDQIPLFIEELLRFDPPTHQLLRKTTAEIEVSGLTIPKGSFVLLMIGAANRDPEYFENPDVFTMGRANVKEHLAFGVGAHTCIGAALARKEIEIILGELLLRFKSFTCPPSASLNWISSMNIRAPSELPTTFN